jgi:hypothetical protein
MAGTFDKAFGLDDFASAFAAAERDVNRLRLIDRHREIVEYDDGSNKCAQSIWHLTDWMFKEAQKRNVPLVGQSFKSAITFGEYVRDQCHDMRACYQFATGAKHAEVRKAQAGISYSGSAVMVPVIKTTPGFETSHAAQPVVSVSKIAMDGVNHIPLDVFDRGLEYMRSLGKAQGFL